VSQVPAAVLATRVGLRSALTVARSSSARSSRSAARKHQLGGLGGPVHQGPHPCGGKTPSRCTAELEVCPSVFPQEDIGRPLACVRLVQSPGRTRRERLVVGLLCTVCGLCGRRMVNC